MELDSADKFYISNEENLELQIGDFVEISYNGEIMESYPAQLGEVYKITVIEQTEANAMWDRIPMVRIDGKLYYDTGRESIMDARCGTMDGEITSMSMELKYQQKIVSLILEVDLVISMGQTIQ